MPVRLFLLTFWTSFDRDCCASKKDSSCDARSVVSKWKLRANAAEMNTVVGYIYDMLYGDSGGYPSFASAAAVILFVIVLTVTCINLLVSKKRVHY